jgi:hypothetical protein
MPRKHVWISIPAYTGTIHMSTFRAITGDVMRFGQRGDTVQLHEVTGCAIISDARNHLVAQFLEGPGTHMVFVDWDVTWQPGGMVTLVDHEVDLVAGIYPKRSDPIKFDLRTLKEGKEHLTIDKKTGLIEVLGAATGFMCMSRHMLQKMTDAYRETLTYPCPKSPGGKAVGLFDTYRTETGSKLGEDYSFCQRWVDLGGKVWLDPHIQMGHIGVKLFAGEFGKWV